MNAIKNEEASQVSKLNDEIKQLKEKLQGQNLYVRKNEIVTLILCKIYFFQYPPLTPMLALNLFFVFSMPLLPLFDFRVCTK